MGLSRDARAPFELTDEQKQEIRDDPTLVKLRRKREGCKEKIYARGYRPLAAAKGTRLHDRYKGYDRKIQSTANTLRKRRLDEVVRRFHDTIDEIEIDRQLDGTGITETVTRPRARYELRERAAIVELMGVSMGELDDEQALRMRSRFVSMLYRLCSRQESRWYRAGKNAPNPNCHEKRDSCGMGPRKRFRPSSPDPKSPASPHLPKQRAMHSPSTSIADADNVPDLYLMRFSYPLCLICIGREEDSYEKRIRPFARKSTAQKHINAHLAAGLFRQRSQCRHPRCSEWIEGDQHFKSHSARKHNVFY